MITTAIDVLIVVVGVLYFVASSLLFIIGGNLALLSVVVWRRGSVAEAPDVIDLDHRQLPRVTVQLPIFNELYVAERVIEAACQLDYPADRLQIQVLDDSTDETVHVVAAAVKRAQHQGFDVVHLHRRQRIGYKAGALADGLKTATGELVAIFDADFVPPPHFLRATVGEFSDEKLAFVQGRWGHLNRNFSIVTKLQSLAIDAHFMVEQAARKHLGFWFNFNGTAGIWRVAAIEDAGGWTADTLTEDLDLSYRAHLRGWHGHYRSDLEVLGEVPAQMSSFRRQQHRWARGSLECARKLLPQVWRSDAGWATKFQATAHLSAYTIHLLLFVLAIIYPVVVYAGIRFDGFATLYGIGYVFAISSLTPAFFFTTGQRELSRSWYRQGPKIVVVAILGSGLMLNTVRAAIEIFTTPNPEFQRTAKFGLDEHRPAEVADGAEPNSWLHKRYLLDLDRIVYAEFGLGLYCLFAARVAFGERNWGILLYASIFAAGLCAVASITVVQAVAVYRSRSRRERQVETELEGVTPDQNPLPEQKGETILVMSKRPIAGASKTRLLPVLSPADAAELSECFLLDTLDLARSVTATRSNLDVRIAGAPEGSGSYFSALAPDLGFVTQVGETLGDRLDQVMSSVLAEHRSVIAINSDSPTLPAALLDEALDRLQNPETDVVLGPADDGGYYLIGWKRPHPRLVKEVTMSTPRVLADTMAIAAQDGLRVDLLDGWYDVDEPEDLARLRADLEAGLACGERTRQFLGERPALGYIQAG